MISPKAVLPYLVRAAPYAAALVVGLSAYHLLNWSADDESGSSVFVDHEFGGEHEATNSRPVPPGLNSDGTLRAPNAPTGLWAFDSSGTSSERGRSATYSPAVAEGESQVSFRINSAPLGGGGDMTPRPHGFGDASGLRALPAVFSGGGFPGFGGAGGGGAGLARAVKDRGGLAARRISQVEEEGESSLDTDILPPGLTDPSPFVLADGEAGFSGLLPVGDSTDFAGLYGDTGVKPSAVTDGFVNVVPENSGTLSLVLIGLGGLAAWRRYRSNAVYAGR